MSDENLFEELAETRRKLWKKGGGTMRGLFDYCHRFAQEDHAKFLAEMEREKAVGTLAPNEDAVPEYAGTMCVHEGEPANYQTTKLANGETDFVREGGEGEA